MGWYDPATGRHIRRYEDAQQELAAARQALETERQAREAAEARVRELEGRAGFSLNAPLGDLLPPKPQVAQTETWGGS